VRLTPGSKLGPYEVLSLIGAGGMGEVYRARDSRLDRMVAIKVLAPELAGDAEFRARFTREAKAISALNHSHICGLYDIGHEHGIDYLVLELLEGETLATRLAQRLHVSGSAVSQPLLHHYAYGKPKETVEQTGPLQRVVYRMRKPW
jgi:serine/threonine protein kinase